MEERIAGIVARVKLLEETANVGHQKGRKSNSVTKVLKKLEGGNIAAIKN